jgi:hypothetical protein
VHSPDSALNIQLDPATQIQVLDAMPDLAGADKEQRGAFIRDERVLVVWTDDLDHIVPLCKEFEQKLIKLVWKSRPTSRFNSTAGPFSQPGSTLGSTVGLNEKIAEEDEDKDAALAELAKDSARAQPPPPKKGIFSFFSRSKPAASTDIEKTDEPEARPMRLFSPVYGGLAAALSLCKCAFNLGFVLD